MEHLPLNLSEYQLAVLSSRLQELRNEKADYTPDLTTETAIRDSCNHLGKFDGQIELMSSLIEEAHPSIEKED